MKKPTMDAIDYLALILLLLNLNLDKINGTTS